MSNRGVLLESCTGQEEIWAWEAKGSVHTEEVVTGPVQKKKKKRRGLARESNSET